MVLRKRKGEAGAAVAYITRKQALRKLQLNLKDFRRLCILKGIHPHQPRHPKKAGKGNTLPRTYYFYKDIQFLLHEPIINNFRQYKIFLRKLKKADDKSEKSRAKHLRQNRPKYKLDRIVKERYPTFTDALRDLDDCLSMLFLFATLPRSKLVKDHLVRTCRRLTVEFMHYVMSSKSLRKVFVSIKGIYYQAEIMGETITWVVPHNLAYKHARDVDFRIMMTFVEFYNTLLGFVNFKLYNSIGLFYPPKLDLGSDFSKKNEDDPQERDTYDERIAALTLSLKSSIQEPQEEVDEFPADLNDDPDHIEKARLEQEKVTRQQTVFQGLKFFLNREVPRECLTFIIRSCGGQVSWDMTMGEGATYQVDNETITHHIIDRTSVDKQFLSRYYLQPQWVFDSVNACKLLPVADYLMGAVLPPHLSPFVEEGEGDYIPPERKQGQAEDSTAELEEDSENEESEEEEDDIDDESEDELAGLEESYEQRMSKRKRTADDSESEETTKKHKAGDDHDPEPNEKAARKAKMSVRAGKIPKVDAGQLIALTNEERKLAEMTIPKKNRRLYKKIMYARKKKAQEVRKLAEKRELFEQEKKQEKKKKKKTQS